MNRHVFKICVASGLVWLVGAGVVQAQVISTWTNNNTVTVLADHVTVTNATLLYFYDASSMDDPRLFIRDGTSGQLDAMMLYGSTGLIPEPGSLILLVAGSAMMLVRRRKMT